MAALLEQADLRGPTSALDLAVFEADYGGSPACPLSMFDPSAREAGLRGSAPSAPDKLRVDPDDEDDP
jgi:hypothetical protein